MFDEQHLDIIQEVVNIGIGEAGAALADLVRRKVVLKVPDLKVVDNAGLGDYLAGEMESLGVYITQDFTGEVTGKSILCYSKEASMELIRTIMAKEVKVLSISDSERAMLEEIGNVILVSCLSAISNSLESRFRFNMPHVTLNGHVAHFRNFIGDLERFEHAVVIKTSMAVEETDITGYIFILLGIQDLRTVAHSMTERYAAKKH